MSEVLCIRFKLCFAVNFYTIKVLWVHFCFEPFVFSLSFFSDEL